MKAAQRVAINSRLRKESVWRLLAADNAPAILALLQTHLLDKERRVASSILHDRIGRDLDILRTRGCDLPQTAQVYLTQWLAAGFLERTFQQTASEEEYELSAAAVQAIRFIDGLTEKHTVATETRLAMVIQQLVLLAEQTESNPETRIQTLMKERQRIDAQIDAINAGKLETLDDERALERSREIIALADELASDFRQVRDEFQKLNRQLRESIMESDGGRGEVLEALFAGVDVIADSDAGRTFKAFWRLLTDPEQSAGLDVALEKVLSRDFAHQLERQEKRFLLQLTRLLLEQGAEVHEVLQNFARGLKQFVQSRDYQQQRRLSRLIKTAQRAALAAKDQIRVNENIGHTLYLTSSKIDSLSRQVLHDPSLDMIEGGVPLAETAEISLEAVSELVAQSEIDFRRLQGHITQLLEKRSQISVAEVMEHYPAEQGLGSVVGYLAIGVRHGVRADSSGASTETVNWEGADGTPRSARIPRIYFIKESFNTSHDGL